MKAEYTQMTKKESKDDQYTAYANYTLTIKGLAQDRPGKSSRCVRTFIASQDCRRDGWRARILNLPVENV